MNTAPLISLLQTKAFKRITLVLGIIFIILSIAISTDPQSFLKYGYPGVFLFNVFGAGTILVPILVKYMDPFVLALVSTCGAAVNESVSWLVGRNGYDLSTHSKKFESIKTNIQKYGIGFLIFWALFPFPYDLIGITAGYLGMPYRSFVMATFAGRFFRFLLLGYGVLEFIK